MLVHRRGVTAAAVHRMPSSLIDLVDRIQAGDRNAEDEFVARYARGVAVILRRACGDRFAVDDLCQDTLATALQKIREGAVRDPERLSGFVASLARNLAIQHGRRTSAHRTSTSDAGRIEDPADDPLERVIRAEDAFVVRQVLEELPTERDREILLRYYIHDQDRDEICAVLGLTREHFARVLFRAKDRFRELYEQRLRGGREKRARERT
jgi:RNA polymerase sigma-70 factor (ECF subfamily)